MLMRNIVMLMKNIEILMKNISMLMKNVAMLMRNIAINLLHKSKKNNSTPYLSKANAPLLNALGQGGFIGKKKNT